ncbi:hypothetical protein ISD85_29345 [Pseudomonas aeruginosa]|uniref:hypothetical protein n=1 Tax=Pseudomonas aeruginosa TaxID=287 RepID=UPI0011406AA0|nr:hypothetical protein [Pseudomonas aeruginosa]MBX5774719.1 hypothetical protein [Pseudomonas aeruginosa]WCU02532.1 hypothetical protein KKY72_25395 [Pseudomonas aeruginosa]HBO9230094.1 hypothetical protein [Pseudomonas aeruginosa]HCZ8855405.1 hypothetical protein [Pseudomonas aeruginosa]
MKLVADNLPDIKAKNKNWHSYAPTLVVGVVFFLILIGHELIGLGDVSAKFVSNALETEDTDWASILTDMVAVSAALGALALPLSLSVIEATRSRYRSPTLLSIYTRLSGTDPQKINLLLFVNLVFAFVLKLYLLANIVEFKYLIPPIFGLSILFLATVSELYKHLSFTYRLMSDSNSIKNIIVDFFERELTPAAGYKECIVRYLQRGVVGDGVDDRRLLIAAMMELETYDICSDSSKRSIDDRIRSLLSLNLKALPDENSQIFLHEALAAFPRMMSEVETQREVDVYQAVAGVYLYLLPMALLKDDSFSNHLGEALRVSRFREKELPPSAQFCRNGRLFLNCLLKDPSRQAYKELFGYFQSLLSNALYSNPVNIPSILGSANNMLFGTRYEDDPAYMYQESINELYTWQGGRAVVEDIRKYRRKKISLEQLELMIANQHKPGMALHLLNMGVVESADKAECKIDKVTEVLIGRLAARDISEAIEVETLQTIGLLLEKEPELVIKCREYINPAGATSINIGRPLVPSSMQSCVAALVYDKFYQDRVFIEELLEFKIVDAVSVLMVYELWKDFIFNDPRQSIDDYMRGIPIPDCSIRELKNARDRIEVLAKSFRKILNNKRISDRLNLLETHCEHLSELCDLLCAYLKEKISNALDEKLRASPIDVGAIERFESEFIDDWKGIFPELPLLHRVKVGVSKYFEFSDNYRREAFLEDTGVHYVFSGFGRNLLRAYHSDMVVRVARKNFMSVNSSLPAPFGEKIFISHDAIKAIESSGFRLARGVLIWPNKMKSMEAFLVYELGDLYYQVYEGQSLVDVSFVGCRNGVPVDFEIIDNKDGKDAEANVTVKVKLNFSLSAVC